MHQKILHHFIGLSNTRWNARAKSLKRLCDKHFFKAVVATIEHIQNNTSDGVVRGSANGLLLAIKQPKFIISLFTLTPFFELIDEVFHYKIPNLIY